ncbi:unnamed protein product [Symbiodinium microadriaticum]|nr:unnamed protein product [Symbiodinium microadriaticum]
MKKVTSFEGLDHGIENPQFFQGCGTSFTSFDHVATGIGDNPAEALEDCLEMIAQGEHNVDTDDLKARILAEYNEGQEFPETPSAHAELMSANGFGDDDRPEDEDEADDWEAAKESFNDSVDSNYYHYSIRYNVEHLLHGCSKSNPTFATEFVMYEFRSDRPPTVEASDLESVSEMLAIFDLLTFNHEAEFLYKLTVKLPVIGNVTVSYWCRENHMRIYTDSQGPSGDDSVYSDYPDETVIVSRESVIDFAKQKEEKDVDADPSLPVEEGAAANLTAMDHQAAEEGHQMSRAFKSVVGRQEYRLSLPKYQDALDRIRKVHPTTVGETEAKAPKVRKSKSQKKKRFVPGKGKIK